MKVSKQTDDTLVLRGYGWLRFAFMICFALATPYFVWLAYLVEWWKGLPIVAILPVCFTFAFWLHHENWQLVLEAAYSRGTLYSGRWFTGQRPHTFDLSEIAEAYIDYEEVYHHKSIWSGRSATEYRIALKRQNAAPPILVAPGSQSEVNSMVCSINRWLTKVRRSAKAA
jgi:hypothetical protein